MFGFTGAKCDVKPKCQFEDDRVDFLDEKGLDCDTWARQSHAINQNGTTSGFEIWFCYRIPAPYVPRVPTKTRLESRFWNKRSFNPILFMIDCLQANEVKMGTTDESKWLTCLDFAQKLRTYVDTPHVDTPHVDTPRLMCLDFSNVERTTWVLSATCLPDTLPRDLDIAHTTSRAVQPSHVFDLDIAPLGYADS